MTEEQKPQREKQSIFEKMAGIFSAITYGRGHESKHRGGRVKALDARDKRRRARKAARKARKVTRQRRG
jgi:hypothetical protein